MSRTLVACVGPAPDFFKAQALAEQNNALRGDPDIHVLHHDTSHTLQKRCTGYGSCDILSFTSAALGRDLDRNLRPLLTSSEGYSRLPQSWPWCTSRGRVHRVHPCSLPRPSIPTIRYTRTASRSHSKRGVSAVDKPLRMRRMVGMQWGGGGGIVGRLGEQHRPIATLTTRYCCPYVAGER